MGRFLNARNRLYLAWAGETIECTNDVLLAARSAHLSLIHI